MNYLIHNISNSKVVQSNTCDGIMLGSYLVSILDTDEEVSRWAWAYTHVPITLMLGVSH